MAESIRKHRFEATKVHLKNFFPSHIQHKVWKILMRNVVFSASCKKWALKWQEVIFKDCHHESSKVQCFRFMSIFLFLKNFAKWIACEHDELTSLIVESDRNFSRNVASTSFVFLKKLTLNTYFYARKAPNSLLFINCLKSINFRQHKKYKFAFLQGFFWFKVIISAKKKYWKKTRK